MFNGSGVDLYWLPLGAGGHSVRLNGRLFEAVAACVHRRRMLDLYHAALEVRLGTERLLIEQAPIPDAHGEQRGVVVEGPVGARWAGRTRILRYEVRRWRDGVIADIAEAVDSPRRLTDDPDVARRLWQSAADLPAPVWGRDELGTGEMWNSNSVISWLITRSGLDVDSIRPPTGGRAPGWQAGVVLAGRVPAKIPCRSTFVPATVLPKEPEEEQSEHDTEAWRDGTGLDRRYGAHVPAAAPPDSGVGRH